MNIKLMALLVFWLAGAGYGVWQMATYSYTPGRHNRDEFKLAAEASPKLLLFIHPRCSCSQATLKELDRLMPSLQGVRVEVIFQHFKGKDTEWTKSDLWIQSTKIAGAVTTIDHEGARTRAFNVSTSGHAFLFDEKGTQIYSGGLTSSRGHEGLSAGQDIIKNWVQTRKQKPAFENVFGCGQERISLDT